MSQTAAFIKRLEDIEEGERSRLRRLAGKPLDETLQGFDLFTGLWWPIRQRSPFAPRRETSWIVAKLYGAFPITHVQGQTVASLLGRLEPQDGRERHKRPHFRRFDALLCSSLLGIEPHLRWAMKSVTDAIATQRASGLDWAQLLDDLSIWDRGEENRRNRDVRDIWAEQYLNSTK